MDEIINNIIKSLEYIKTEDEITELRILNTDKGTVSGYFNNHELLARSAEEFDGKVPGLYITLNPVTKNITNNKLIYGAKKTTSDKDIKFRKWFLIDLDPIRSAGTSATEEEHLSAFSLANNIRQYLLGQGWPEPILADSGNGYHLLYRINLPNDDFSRDLLKKTLEALDFQFSNKQVNVDRTTYNASRIMRLYGTKTCKGINLEDRPHRYSGIIEVPERIAEVSIDLMQQISKRIDIMPNKQKFNSNDTTNFDLDSWLSKNAIEVAFKGEWQKNATKYVLENCPWNSKHTNRSAYIIQFSNGAIAAGCHHNSCSEEDWHSLRRKVDPSYGNNISKHKKKDTQADILIRLANEASYFQNELEEAHAAVAISGHTELWKVKSKKYKMWLTKMYFEETGQAPTSDAMNQALGVVEMKAMFDGEEHPLQLRVAEQNGKYYYDLSDKKWQAIEISPLGCKLLENPPILFTRNKNTKAQVLPNFNGDLRRILKHVRLKNEDDEILYMVYIITCFIPKIPHAVLVFSGEKGASKSTSMRITRQVIDPAIRDLLTMPNSIQDLAISLANNYMPCFDNLDNLSAQKSDLLCIASTGGGFSKRTLFTDDDETLLELRRCPALNGINVVVTRPDLMDRSIPLELERIPEEERKEESEVWSAFESDRASIVGGALQTLSKAMAIYPTVKLNKLPRMADFNRWGYAIAEAMGYGGERFLEAYRNNQSKSNEEAISSHPVAAAIVSLMRNTNKWDGTVANLLNVLEYEAGKERINTNVKMWPKAAHILSRRLKEVKSNLLEVGISFEIRHAGDAKKVTLIKQEDNVVNENQNDLREISQNDIELSPNYDEFAEW